MSSKSKAMSLFCSPARLFFMFCIAINAVSIAIMALYALYKKDSQKLKEVLDPRANLVLFLHILVWTLALCLLCYLGLEKVANVLVYIAITLVVLVIAGVASGVIVLKPVTSGDMSDIKPKHN